MFVVDTYDVIVIGAGHAGCEAALASARLGAKTLMATLNLDNIALMPCNPAVGGPGKSHLVREIDALGGEMGINTDKTCLQMRMLNTGKGPAVYSLRAQSDKKMYQLAMTKTLENQENLDVKQLMITDLLVEDGAVTGVRTELDEVYKAKCVILATGTYLKGKIIIGTCTYSGGPIGQRSAEDLSGSLLKAGLKLMRFKTGTPARVDRRTLRTDEMAKQEGDKDGHAFSFLSERKDRNKECCWLTFTNEETHKIIRDNLDRAPMCNGIITGIGPRYCPSIESKIVRFADKKRHQLFIEPEGESTEEMYVQGMSTSMPADVQYAFLRTIPGLEDVKIMRPGYAIEYDCLDPTQLTPWLETKKISGLFSAGQANGTSGYEEAAAQGLMAGINAALKIQGKDPFILTRSEAYIGVLIDDLVTKGTNEPYRIMTSRSEYRLLHRQDNADERLSAIGHRICLVSDAQYAAVQEKYRAVAQEIRRLESSGIPESAALNAMLTEKGTAAVKGSARLADLVRRPQIAYDDLAPFDPERPALPKVVREAVEIQMKYAGYIARQQKQVEDFQREENRLLPPDADYAAIGGLRVEARQKLAEIRPLSIGQASRISGVSPADIAVLLIWLGQQEQ